MNVGKLALLFGWISLAASAGCSEYKPAYPPGQPGTTSDDGTGLEDGAGSADGTVSSDATTDNETDAGDLPVAGEHSGNAPANAVQP